MKTRIFIIGFILTMILSGCPIKNPPINTNNNNDIDTINNNNDSTGLDELGKDSLCYGR